MCLIALLSPSLCIDECPSAGASVYMPFPASLLRRRLKHQLSLSHVNTLLLSPTSPHTATIGQQTRVLRTSNSSCKTRPTLSLRSPHQWSHIAHRIRKPAAATTTMGAEQKRSHGGHSHGHGHHHHHDNTFLTSKNRNDPGVKITRIGLYVNLGMAIAKGAGGYVFNSQA